MRSFHGSFTRTMCGIAVFSTFTVSSFAQSQKSGTENSAPVAQEETATTALPDSPGTVMAQNSVQQTGNNSQQTSTSQPLPAQNDKPQRPVGTAAAEAPVVSGVTAAQPAGVAIAPAKQHRARSLVIKVGAIVGAGAAVGAVVALSAGTSSKPPGAR